MYKAILNYTGSSWPGLATEALLNRDKRLTYKTKIIYEK